MSLNLQQLVRNQQTKRTAQNHAAVQQQQKVVAAKAKLKLK